MEGVHVPHERHRKVTLDDSVRDLSRNIAQVGLLHPIHVRENGTGGWNLIAGARRLLAHKILGHEQIKAQVHPLLTGEHHALQDELIEISENLKRLSLTPLEDANHLRRYDEILDELGLRTRRGQPGTATRRTTAQLATERGMSTRTYKNRLAVGRMSAVVQERVREMPIARRRGELIKLAYVGDEDQQLAVLDVIDEGAALNVRDALDVLEPVVLTDPEVEAFDPLIWGARVIAAQLQPQQKYLLLVLGHLADHEGDCSISSSQIALSLGLKKRITKNYIRAALAVGWLIETNNSKKAWRNGAKVYRLVMQKS